MQSREIQQHLKTVVIGKSGSGKSALIGKYYQSANGGGSTALRIYEIGASPRFHLEIPPIYMRETDCCVFMYDIGDRHSFEMVEQWKTAFLEASTSEIVAIPYILVGNKADKERQVGWSEAQTWARENGDLSLFETSAKTGSNVREVFEQAGRLGLVTAQQRSCM